MLRRVALILIQLAAAVMIYLGVKYVVELRQIKLPQSVSYAIWNWQGPGSKVDPQQIKAWGFNRVYLRIDDSLDILEMPAGTDRDAKLAAFEQQLAGYTEKAHRDGLRVEGLGGNNLWGNDSHRYLTTMLVDFTSNYNKRVGPQQRLDGLQFDIEPVTQKDFSNNKSDYLKQYLDTVQAIVQQKNQDFGAQHFGLGFTAQAGAMTDQSNNPVTWQDQSKPLGDHLLDIVSQTQDGYVAVLAYRQQPVGNDSSFALAEPFLRYAKANNQPTQLILGLESGQEEPAKISFYGRSKKALASAIGLIYQSAKPYPNFAGFAINDLSSYQELKD